MHISILFFVQNSKFTKLFRQKKSQVSFLATSFENSCVESFGNLLKMNLSEIFWKWIFWKYFENYHNETVFKVFKKIKYIFYLTLIFFGPNLAIHFFFCREGFFCGKNILYHIYVCCMLNLWKCLSIIVTLILMSLRWHCEGIWRRKPVILVEVTGGIIAGIDKEAMVLVLGDAVCGIVDCGVNSYPVTSLYLFLLGCFLAYISFW